MLVEQIEGKWVDVFKEVFDLCRVAVGDEVVILSESQSRQVNVRLADLALLALGAKVFHLVLPSPELIGNVPVRSTGSSDVLRGRTPVIAALSNCIPFSTSRNCLSSAVRYIHARLFNTRP